MSVFDVGFVWPSQSDDTGKAEGDVTLEYAQPSWLIVLPTVPLCELGGDPPKGATSGPSATSYLHYPSRSIGGIFVHLLSKSTYYHEDL